MSRIQPGSHPSFPISPPSRRSGPVTDFLQQFDLQAASTTSLEGHPQPLDHELSPTPSHLGDRLLDAQGTATTALEAPSHQDRHPLSSETATAVDGALAVPLPGAMPEPRAGLSTIAATPATAMSEPSARCAPSRPLPPATPSPEPISPTAPPLWPANAGATAAPPLAGLSSPESLPQQDSPLPAAGPVRRFRAEPAIDRQAVPGEEIASPHQDSAPTAALASTPTDPPPDIGPTRHGSRYPIPSAAEPAGSSGTPTWPLPLQLRTAAPRELAPEPAVDAASTEPAPPDRAATAAPVTGSQPFRHQSVPTNPLPVEIGPHPASSDFATALLGQSALAAVSHTRGEAHQLLYPQLLHATGHLSQLSGGTEVLPSRVAAGASGPPPTAGPTLPFLAPSAHAAAAAGVPLPGTKMTPPVANCSPTHSLDEVTGTGQRTRTERSFLVALPWAPKMLRVQTAEDGTCTVWLRDFSLDADTSRKLVQAIQRCAADAGSSLTRILINGHLAWSLNGEP